MVQLTDPTPADPIAGQEFSIGVTGGTPPFVFTWMLGDDDPIEEEPEGHILDIDIPRDATGKELTVSVRDAMGDGDSMSWTVQAKAPND